MAEPALDLEALAACHQQLKDRRHRLLVIMAGDGTWSRPLSAQILAHLAIDDVVRFGSGEGDLPWHQARRLLGGEHDGVLFDAREEFDGDAFGAVYGVVAAGGCLILLVPELDAWRRSAQLSLRRLVSVIETDEGPVLWCQGQAPRLPRLPQRPLTTPDYTEQREAVAAVLHVVQGHRRRPLVLVADRGRGKSAAMGMAAATLMTDASRRILVTAPRRSAADKVFEHAQGALSLATQEHDRLVCGKAELIFCAPDQLVAELPECDLLLVDEAAAIPVALLKKMLRHYSRIVFASTVHGYEGSGRGFDLRFRNDLDEQAPGWRRMRLSQPIRWAEQDPLESFAFNALLLAANPVATEALAGWRAQDTQYMFYDRQVLAQEPARLAQVFGLLVNAHYRTSPNDLIQLLDQPGLHLLLALWQEQVIAAVLLNEEGGLPAPLAAQVFRGERRAQGHLLAQTLAAHGRFPFAAERRYARIQRIAVHDALRRQGVATALIAAATRQAQDWKLDFLGVSFSADAELAAFWRKRGLTSVRLGFTRETSSGLHSLVMLEPLRREKRAELRLFQQAFAEDLLHGLVDVYAEVSPALIVELMRSLPHSGRELNALDVTMLETFADSHRSYEASAPVLTKLTILLLEAEESSLFEEEKTLLVAKCLQRKNWQVLAKDFSLPGRKAVIDTLRQIVSKGLRSFVE